MRYILFVYPKAKMFNSDHFLTMDEGQSLIDFAEFRTACGGGAYDIYATSNDLNKLRDIAKKLTSGRMEQGMFAKDEWHIYDLTTDRIATASIEILYGSIKWRDYNRGKNNTVKTIKGVKYTNYQPGSTFKSERASGNLSTEMRKLINSSKKQSA